MKLFTRADSKTVKQTLAIYKATLGSEKKRLVIAAILIPLHQLFYVVLLPLLLSLYTQNLLEHSPNSTYQWWLIAGMVGVGIGALVCSRFGFIALFNHQERMTTHLTEYAANGLLSHSYAFFTKNKVGALAGEVNTFSRSYLSLMDTIFLQASSVVINFIASIIIVACIAPLMLPAIIGMTFVVIYLALRSYLKRSPYRTKRKELQSQLMGSIGDVIGNQTLVRMFGRRHHEVETLITQRRAIEKVASEEIKILEDGAELRLGFLIAAQIATLSLCGWLYSNNLLGIAALVFILTYLGRVTSGLFAINSTVRMAEQAFLDASKVTEILSSSSEVIDAPHAKKITVSKGALRFDAVHFAYSDVQNQAVFSGVNLHIPAGQSVGLVGRSGGGKTTLTHLLLRYMDIQSGSITIDGQDIAHVTQDSLRGSIAYVPQDPFLFHRTLRENIAYGNPDASDEAIIVAVKKANAWEFVQKLPHGLDTVVGERGVKLSGGQRQRIAIARAILKDAPILVLDEATSALDSESEKLIQNALETLMKDRTSIVIAHRLSTIAKLDRIIVLDDGKIVEDNTHQALLAKNGIYAKLWSHQSGGFIED
ncbi:ABC transporter ATP-binding protein [Candidatus Saccharibacteria bacterium]|nr:ABC transporter ATP-binding protein [Candidatus Saccharibacteria bacterium]